MNENGYQSVILKAIEEEKEGSGFKLSHRQFVGVADLYVKMNKLDGAFIEVKLALIPIKPRDFIKVDLTEPQRRFLVERREHGDIAALLVVLARKNKLMMSITDIVDVPKTNKVRFEEFEYINHRRNGTRSMNITSMLYERISDLFNKMRQEGLKT